MCFPVTEYRREGKRMRWQVKGIHWHFLPSRAVKKCTIKTFMWGGGGERGGRVVDREGETVKDA